MRTTALLLTLGLSIGLSTGAGAATTVGALTFQDNAFADALLASSGSYTTSGESLEDALTDTSPYTWAFSLDGGAFLTLGFTDNVVVNGAGADLALFELGIADTFTVTLNGTTLSFPTAPSGAFNVNVALVDLAAFGIAPGDAISQVTLGFIYNPATQTLPSTSLVGALNSANALSPVPVPAALPLFASVLGIGSLLGYRRKRRTAMA